MLPAPGRTKTKALLMIVTYGPVKERATQENVPKKHVWFAVHRATEPVFLSSGCHCVEGHPLRRSRRDSCGLRREGFAWSRGGKEGVGRRTLPLERLQHLQAAPAPKNPKLGARGATATRRREASRGRCRALVERFDIEANLDFSVKLSKFRGLVLFCIGAKLCKKIFVGKLLTRSTRCTCFCTAQTSIFQKIFVRPFFAFFGK